MIGAERLEVQLDPVSINVKLTVPALTPVTTPELLIVAILGLLLVHIPPLVGVIDEVPPMQIELKPVICIFGLAYIVTGDVLLETQPVVLVNLNVT